MDALRRHPIPIALAVAALAVLVALFVPVPGGSGSGDDSAGGPTPGATLAPRTPSPAPSASMTPAADDAEAGGLVRTPLTVQADPPGLSGSGGSFSIRTHRITLSARSSEPIGVVGYLIPTSKERSSGTARGVGRSWSLSTVVYGRPDYAQMFLQAGPTGASITCTITVDGKVTEQRSSSGPYGQLFCQG